MVYALGNNYAGKSNFEVDSTESVWYIGIASISRTPFILKLTPQSQYGIKAGTRSGASTRF